MFYGFSFEQRFPLNWEWTLELLLALKINVNWKKLINLVWKCNWGLHVLKINTILKG